MANSDVYIIVQFILISSHLSSISVEAALTPLATECINVAGNNPQWKLSNAKQVDSVATCPTGYTVTSCGAISLDVGNEDDILGAYFYGNGCKAETYWRCPALIGCLNGGGVIAHARCCKLETYGFDVSNIVNSTKSAATDDASATVSCPSALQMIGCSGYVSESRGRSQFDGTSIEKTTRAKCIAKNGADGSGAIAQAQCYGKLEATSLNEMDCVVVIGLEGETSTVACPSSGYFMTSCNGYSSKSNLVQFTIDNNICTVKHDVALFAGSVATASAMCCRVYRNTPHPTSAPIINVEITQQEKENSEENSSIIPMLNLQNLIVIGVCGSLCCICGVLIIYMVSRNKRLSTEVHFEASKRKRAPSLSDEE